MRRVISDLIDEIYRKKHYADKFNRRDTEIIVYISVKFYQELVSNPDKSGLSVFTRTHIADYEYFVVSSNLHSNYKIVEVL